MGATASALTAATLFGPFSMGNKTENISNTFVNSIVNQAISTIISNNNTTLVQAGINIDCDDPCLKVLINNCIYNACSIPTKDVTSSDCTIKTQIPTEKVTKSCDIDNIKQCNDLKCDISDIKLTQSIIISSSLDQQNQLASIISNNIENSATQTIKNAGSSGAGIFTPFSIGNTTKNIVTNNIDSIIKALNDAIFNNEELKNIKNTINISGSAGTKVKGINSTQASNIISQTIQNNTAIMNIINDISSSVIQDITSSNIWIGYIVLIVLLIVFILVCVGIGLAIIKYNVKKKIKSKSFN
jgi:hypothetical protein